MLQTDAAINSGNSGGPLLNMAGQVVGINTLVVRGGGFSEAEGLGFAIPSNVAQSVVRNLIEPGEARSPFLGIQYQPLNPQLASEVGLNIFEGALLETIVDGTPAERAGLQVGDVIVAIEGTPVDDRHSLVSLLLEHVAGYCITNANFEVHIASKMSVIRLETYSCLQNARKLYKNCILAKIFSQYQPFLSARFGAFSNRTL